MNRRYAILFVILMVFPLFVLAQDQDQGRVWGDYTVRQSIELGGHIADSDGNQQTYLTFVNLKSGPRLLGQDLSMQSISHQGLLFDNLYISSFGFGGDPENMARLRVSKNKLYNFVGVYRRDKNFFDYNLFANPLNLNAGVTTCGGPVGGPPTCVNQVSPTTLPWYENSPHLQATTRNMGDFLLTLLPDSVVSVRLGYARNATHGTLWTTAGQPFVTTLLEDSEWRSDRYQFGADLKMLPRTTLSLDVIFEHDKNDLAYQNDPGFVLGSATGLPVDIGLTFFPSTTSPPCISSAGPPPVLRLSSTCTGATLGLFKRGNVRTDIPTGQLSFVSNYFRKLNITASGSYSSASSDFRNFSEFNYGTSPTLLTGPASNGRISANADLGVTYQISKSWSVSNKFRWVNWRQPGALTLTTFTCSHASGATLLSAFLNPCSQATDLFALITGVNSGATVSGNATSGNFQTIDDYGALIGERSYFNTAKLNWQPSRRFSGYLGYRYGRRTLSEGVGLRGGSSLNPPAIFFRNTTTISNVCQLSGNPTACTTPNLSTDADVETEQINQHTALFGVVVRPVEAWRINGDVELLYADNFFINLNPRHQQRVRVYTNYKVKPWASINAGLHFIETRNDFAAGEEVEGGTTALFPASFISDAYGHKNHWRYYTLGVSLNPNPKFIFDLGWTLQDQNIRSATCMPVQGPPASGANSFTGLTPPAVCNNGSTARALLLDYQESTHSGYTNISFQPVKRVTLSLGYEITADNGHTNWRRLDDGTSLQVVGDVFGNVPPQTGNAISPCPGGSVAAGCILPGPFPDQPLGPQAINWHKAHTGIALELARGVQFKGVWSYYDYNGKDHDPALALLFVTPKRDFHANVGTLSLKYTF